ncbi:unnamed protein product [Prorocentrum cordatum]|uniref:Protein HIRA n=1 Tax=Prorocentrum cordatum TaxID=2364126 RepID=A0ABN9THZ2_9DINO|nr:unnamed protein product [Polarella glacialis]
MPQAWLDTAHHGPIHAVQLDHFGKRLATASSDHRVRVWDVESRQLVVELGRDGPPSGHGGAIWAVAWAHPTHGQVLASAGEDRCVLFWRGPVWRSDSTGETEDDWCAIPAAAGRGDRGGLRPLGVRSAARCGQPGVPCPALWTRCTRILQFWTFLERSHDDAPRMLGNPCAGVFSR